jgi:hypothetical protein
MNRGKLQVGASNQRYLRIHDCYLRDQIKINPQLQDVGGEKGHFGGSNRRIAG